MVAVIRSLAMRDLRRRWVFPRLAYATTRMAIDRNIRRTSRFMFVRPAKRVAELRATWRSHERKAEVFRAGTEAIAEVLRSLALLVGAAAALALQIAKF